MTTTLLRSEMLKLRTVPLPRLMLLLAALGGGILGFAAAQIAHHQHDPLSVTQLATFAAQPLWFLAVIVAVLATAGEFHHGTIQLSLLHVPRRDRLLTAKLVTAAGYGAAITLIGTATCIAVGLLTRTAQGAHIAAVDPHLLGTIATAAALGAVWAVLAAALGTITRSTAAALVAVLLWRFALEGILPMLTGTPELRRWLPSGTTDALLNHHPELLSPWAAALLLAGYSAALTLTGAYFFIHRDST
jgi:ABC-type transport system involved in multi-copper enzyme maturation permease subunit